MTLAGVSHQLWSRQSHPISELGSVVQESTHVWLAISDQALQDWALRLQNSKALLLHSSGALEISGAHSVHPLMTFTHDLYPDDFYRQFAFVTTSTLGREILIPGLANPFFQIKPEHKTFYHALCVLAGNGSVLLWQKFFFEMKKLGLPQAVSGLYAQRIFQNLLDNPALALTGPFVRDDQITLQKDLESLSKDPFQNVFLSMMQAYSLEGKKLV